MAQQILNNGEGGLVIRNKLNGMFNELYGAIILPLRISNVNSNTQQTIAGNAYLQAIYITATDNNPTIRIGLTPNGQEVLEDIQPGSFIQLNVEQYFSEATQLYISISGGTLNIRFAIINDFY